MKKMLLAITLLTASLLHAQPKQLSNETPDQKAKRMQWWTDARFGMFIHWGLYAQAARHEWVKQREQITTENYQKYFDHFNPDEFDPKKWAKEAKAAGMKYAVLTTKHHEGFCLFDSKYTDYKATNTQAKRDLVKEFVDAFRAEGIKIGFYYSLIDWHHPDFTLDHVHPQRLGSDATEADYAALNKGKDMSRYRQYMQNQIKELLTNYGKIDIMWLDFSYPGKNGKGHDDWGSIELLKLIRKLQPGIIVDNRLDLNDYTDGYDFETPEQVKPSELLKYKGKYWETCQTFSGSWGYYRDENTWKSHRQLLDLLITSAANGGNLILNVGPTARGEFDYRANNALDSIAYWMHANNRSIYNCTYPPDTYKLPEGLDIKQTYNPETKRLYLHLFTYPSNYGKLVLPGYADKIQYAQFLHDASEVLYKTENGDIVLELPKQKPPYEIPVIELFLK
ncbi:alpha-L-fucosidase [Niabella beijingensis]|uniref:alpha-L-fucosidase n=1 Tax=Niabella beijingensis TaxID=2872700 RepID=UPI001CBEF4BA|nr:alpha-L-fucosidase [Niabella beijingensis]MBZ4187471.1 alpha-L-fucosidase [Niabella beijingensis]